MCKDYLMSFHVRYGHPKINKQIDTIKQEYYIKGLSKRITKQISHFYVCKTYKHNNSHMSKSPSKYEN